LQIRAEEGEKDQAAAIKPLVERASGETFSIQTVHNVTKNYLSVCVCQ